VRRLISLILLAINHDCVSVCSSSRPSVKELHAVGVPLCSVGGSRVVRVCACYARGACGSAAVVGRVEYALRKPSYSTARVCDGVRRRVIQFVLKRNKSRVFVRPRRCLCAGRENLCLFYLVHLREREREREPQRGCRRAAPTFVILMH
jgi:hypothetical protein